MTTKRDGKRNISFLNILAFGVILLSFSSCCLDSSKYENKVVLRSRIDDELKQISA